MIAVLAYSSPDRAYAMTAEAKCLIHQFHQSVNASPTVGPELMRLRELREEYRTADARRKQKWTGADEQRFEYVRGQLRLPALQALKPHGPSPEGKPGPDILISVQRASGEYQPVVVKVRNIREQVVPPSGLDWFADCEVQGGRLGQLETFRLSDIEPHVQVQSAAVARTPTLDRAQLVRLQQELRDLQRIERRNAAQDEHFQTVRAAWLAQVERVTQHWESAPNLEIGAGHRTLYGKPAGFIQTEQGDSLALVATGGTRIFIPLVEIDVSSIRPFQKLEPKSTADVLKIRDDYAKLREKAGRNSSLDSVEGATLRQLQEGLIRLARGSVANKVGDGKNYRLTVAEGKDFKPIYGKLLGLTPEGEQGMPKLTVSTSDGLREIWLTELHPGLREYDYSRPVERDRAHLELSPAQRQSAEAAADPLAHQRFGARLAKENLEVALAEGTWISPRMMEQIRADYVRAGEASATRLRDLAGKGELEFEIRSGARMRKLSGRIESVEPNGQVTVTASDGKTLAFASAEVEPSSLRARSAEPRDPASALRLTEGLWDYLHARLESRGPRPTEIERQELRARLRVLSEGQLLLAQQEGRPRAFRILRDGAPVELQGVVVEVVPGIGLAVVDRVDETGSRVLGRERIPVENFSPFTLSAPVARERGQTARLGEAPLGGTEGRLGENLVLRSPASHIQSLLSPAGITLNEPILVMGNDQKLRMGYYQGIVDGKLQYRDTAERTANSKVGSLAAERISFVHRDLTRRPYVRDLRYIGASALRMSDLSHNHLIFGPREAKGGARAIESRKFLSLDEHGHLNYEGTREQAGHPSRRYEIAPWERETSQINVLFDQPKPIDAKSFERVPNHSTVTIVRRPDRNFRPRADGAGLRLDERRVLHGVLEYVSQGMARLRVFAEDGKSFVGTVDIEVSEIAEGSRWESLAVYSR